MPSTTVTAFRQALAADLAAALGITFLEGKLEGPQTGAVDIGCTWPGTIQRDSADANRQEIFVFARVFKVFAIQRTPETPLPDPVLLEALAETVQTTIRANRTANGMWFMWLERIDFDMESNSFTCLIGTTQQNIAEIT